MFYSHEILTSRKYGVATVWLVATLGAKSAAKKVNRKAILDVNVKKACETIIQPEAPMALRLQSNLLYGVSRVYSEQCGYMLADTQVAQHALRRLLRAVKHNELDPNAGKAQPGQLILMDDPAFMPDMVLPDFDFDFSNLKLDRTALLDSQGSALSPHSRSRRGSTASRAGSMLGLVIPNSDADGYQPPLHGGLQLPDSSVYKNSGLGLLFQDEEEAVFDEFDFEFDENGNIRDISAEERELRRVGRAFPQISRLGSDSAASGRVRLEHEEARARFVQGAIQDEEGDFIMQFDDEPPIFPDVEAFPPMIATATARSARPNSADSAVLPTMTSSISAEAPLRKRKRKEPKTAIQDKHLELQNAELRGWQTDYLKNMDAALQHKKVHRAPIQARKNAYAWVFGNGLGNVGRSTASADILDMFSGANLMAAITGVPTATVLRRSAKHPHDDNENEEGSEARRVRARADAEEHQVGRGGEDDGFAQVFDESVGPEAPEVGRDAQSALEDHASSAMPWNISASLHSYRNLPGQRSSSIQGLSAMRGRQSSVAGGRPPSRLTNPSPLQGRGNSNMQDLEILHSDFDHSQDEFAIMDQNNLGGEGRTLCTSRAETEAQEFEIFGPTAVADTQTAQTSQWIKEALARESLNFLEYIRNTIQEQEIDELDDDEMAMRVLANDNGVGKTEVSFEMLFPPETNSMMVAAQAFHHVLTLATKNLLSVRQEQMWGNIWMGVKSLTV